MKNYTIMKKDQDTYTVTIPKPPEQSTQVRYYFVATDPNFTTTYPPSGEAGPLVVSINSVALPQEKGLILEGPAHGPVFNAPNPFNPMKGSTYFCYSLSNDAQVQIMIYTLNAQLIKRIDIQDFVGYHEVAWDGRDNAGDFVPNGVYLMAIKASANGKSVVKRNKIAVLRKD